MWYEQVWKTNSHRQNRKIRNSKRQKTVTDKITNICNGAIFILYDNGNGQYNNKRVKI